MSLLVSLHDVAPPHLAAVRRLRAALARWGVSHVTLLAVPRYHDRRALGACRETTRFLRTQLQQGDEICLHGDRHLQAGPISSWRDRLRAQLWTAGEGECLALDDAASMTMLVSGREVLQDLLGEPVRGFVAPAWLEPPTFHRALLRTGFLWHEGGPWVARLDEPGGRRLVSRLPVVGFATRTLLREAVSVSWGRLLGYYLARRVQRSARAGRDEMVRVALHPSDLASPAVMRAAETIIRALVAQTPPRTYASALGQAASARPALAASSLPASPPTTLPATLPVCP